MGDMAAYLDELDAKATDYAVRVQIACAQAVIEAIREQPRFIHWSGAATKPEDASGDATAAWEAHKKAYEIVRAEMDDLHATLTVAGVPEQIPPFKTGRAPAKARVLFLACDRDNLKRELDAAVEFHRHALDVTYPCLPMGEPDTEPDRWTAIAHRMAELEADRDALRQALREIRDTVNDPREIAHRALAASEVLK